MKLRKRFAAMCAAAVMALGTLGIEASAIMNGAPSVTGSGIPSNHSVTYQYQYITSSYKSGDHKFYVAANASYTVTFSPSSGASSNIKFLYNNNQEFLILAPQAAPGMPSQFTNTYTLSNTKKYEVRVKSNGTSLTSGWFNISGSNYVSIE